MDETILFWLDHLHERSPEGAAAREAIRDIWSDQPDRLINVLKEGRYVMRARAADALGMVRDPAAVPALIRALDDEIDAVQGHAASALGVIGDKRATPALLRMLQDRDVWVRWAAADALGYLRDPAATLPLLEAWLNADEPALLDVITDSFRRMSDVVLPTLQIAQNDPREDVRRAAAYMIEKMEQ